MTTTDPTQMLDEVRRLRGEARKQAQGGAWLPVALLAALLLGSIALYAIPFAQPHELWVSSPYWAGLPDQQRNALASYAYWFVGTPAMILLIGRWYRWRADRIGIRVPWRRFAATGLGALVLLTVLAAMPLRDPRDFDPTMDAQPVSSAEQALHGLLTPLVAIGLAVIVLGRLERSRAVALSGVWVTVIAWWQCSQGMGRLTGWMVWILGGFEGRALGGTFTLFGLNRPGPTLILMTLPLLVFATVRAIRTRGGLR